MLTGSVLAIALVNAEAAPAAPADNLKRLIAELKATAPAETWASFEKAQQRWDAYAKADCEWKRTLFDGGSIGAQQYGRCMNGKARARIAELKLLLCEGYGVAGSCDASVKYDNPGE
jgi:uncharacterized protein YecT (DUF1311 family)